MKNTMTVAELIQALSTFSPDAKVAVQIHEDEHPMPFEKMPKPYITTKDDARACGAYKKGEIVCLLDVAYGY